MPSDGGHRVSGPREKAEVFPTRLEARPAIGKMPIAFENAGLVFSVEMA